MMGSTQASGPSQDGRHHHGNKRRRQNSNWESRRGRPRRRPNHHPPTASAVPTCSLCSKENPKYKCPKCRATYCTVQCCRLHKQEGCSNVVTETEKSAVITSSSSSSKYLPSEDLVTLRINESSPRHALLHRFDEDDLEDGWKITDEMKKAMESFDWLRKELQDLGLQHIIRDICCQPTTVIHRADETTHQQVALEQAKTKYPNFASFIDKLLVMTEILERQEHETDLEEWLNRSEGDSGPLAMVPIEKKRRTMDRDSFADDDDDASSSSSDDDSGSGESETSCSDNTEDDDNK